jgi:hypothetical protein
MARGPSKRTGKSTQAALSHSSTQILDRATDSTTEAIYVWLSRGFGTKLDKEIAQFTKEVDVFEYIKQRKRRGRRSFMRLLRDFGGDQNSALIPDKFRDLEIALAVAMIVKTGLFKATRSHTVRRLNYPSACSIVRAALARLGEHRSERTIEGIWNRYKQDPGVSAVIR